MVPVNIWFWVGFIAFVLAMLALDLGVFHRRRARGSAEGSGDLDRRLGRAGARVRRRPVLLLRPRSRPDVPHRLRHRGIAQRRQHLRHRADLRVLPRAEELPAPRAVLRNPRRAGHARRCSSASARCCIARFHWILYVFGAMLVDHRHPHGAQAATRSSTAKRTPIVRARAALHSAVARAITGKHFFVVESGRRFATPLLLVLILVEFTDLVFAVDSIPAIFGVTTDPFIVFTSNIFAILGLRSLYFLLAAVVDRFYLLKYGLARDPDVRRREDARRELLPHRHRALARRSSSACWRFDRRASDLAKKDEAERERRSRTAR